MTRIKRLYEPLAVLAVLCLPVFAIAQATGQMPGQSPGDIASDPPEAVIDPAVDINRDGFYSYPELRIIFPDMTADDFTLIDASGDGLLDEHEVRAAIEAGRWPAKVD